MSGEFSDAFELSDDSDCEYEAQRRTSQDILFNNHRALPEKEIQSKRQYSEYAASSTKNLNGGHNIRHDSVANKDNRLFRKWSIRLGIHKEHSYWSSLKTPFIVFAVLILLRKGLLQMDDQITNDPLYQIERNNHDMNYDSTYDSSIDNVVADVFSFFEEKKDTPFLWTIPFATDALENIIMECWSQKIADAASMFDFETDLRVVTVPLHGKRHHTKIILSPDLLMTSMFTSDHRGRLFTILKHPIYRSIDEYDYYKNVMIANLGEAGDTSDDERLKAERIKTMSLEDYAKSDFVPDNFLTRQLCRISLNQQQNDWQREDDYNRELTVNDLQYAKEVLRRKCLVGVTSRMEEFIDRVLLYLHLKSHHKHKHHASHNDKSFDAEDIDQEKKKTCRSSILNDWVNTQSHATSADGKVKNSDIYPQENEMVFQELMKKNMWDIQLYNYGEHLFDNEHGLINYKIRRQRPQSEQVITVDSEESE